jgi:hypothetical protein
LRKEEDIISNTNSAFENEVILRQEEELKNQGKIEVPLELSGLNVE